MEALLMEAENPDIPVRDMLASEDSYDGIPEVDKKQFRKQMSKRDKKPGIQTSRRASREGSQGNQKRDYQKALEGLFGVKIVNEKPAQKKIDPQHKL